MELFVTDMNALIHAFSILVLDLAKLDELD